MIEPKRINRYPRSLTRQWRQESSKALPSWVPFLLGVVMVIVGFAVVTVGLGLVPVDLGEKAPPGWVVAGFGMIFALPGLVCVLATRDAVSGGEGGGAMEEDPANAQWIADDGQRELRRLLYPMFVLACFLVPFQCLLFLYFIPESGGAGRWLAWIVCGLFDVVLLGYVLTFLHRGLRLLRFGAARVHLEHAPCKPGETVRVGFEGGRGLRALSGVQGTLRCVEERWEEWGKWKTDSPRLVCYLLHEDTRELSTDRAGHAELDVSFPAHVSSVDSPDGAVRYWELAVSVKRGLLTYEGVFLLPVEPASVG